MKQVARMLGVELGEEFRIQGYDNNLKFKFSDNFFLQSCGTGWHESYSIMRVLEGNGEIIKLPKPILDDEEKKYLSRIIKPWRDKAKFIIKQKCDEGEYITIIFSEYYTDCEMPFPIFETGTMYKGMEINNVYTIEELGL